jgi:hypothetical protein
MFTEFMSLERLDCVPSVNSPVLQTPYTQFSNAQTVEKVLSGYRMTPPDNCPDEISKLMIQTWDISFCSPIIQGSHLRKFVIIRCD